MGWGVSVIVGLAPLGKEIQITPLQLLAGKTLKGTMFGGEIILFYYMGF